MTFENGQIEEFNEEARSAGTPVLDLERYRARLDGLSISQEEKDEFLRALWYIMCSFAYAGWGLDSVQNIFPFLDGKTSPESPSALECEEQSHALAFEAAAHDPAEKGR